MIDHKPFFSTLPLYHILLHFARKVNRKKEKDFATIWLAHGTDISVNPLSRAEGGAVRIAHPSAGATATRGQGLVFAPDGVGVKRTTPSLHLKS